MLVLQACIKVAGEVAFTSSESDLAASWACSDRSDPTRVVIVRGQACIDDEDDEGRHESLKQYVQNISIILLYISINN